jgi:hypothetical protein
MALLAASGRCGTHETHFYAFDAISSPFSTSIVQFILSFLGRNVSLSLQMALAFYI